MRDPLAVLLVMARGTGGSRAGTGEHRDSGGHEHLVLDGGPVEVGVRPDQDGVPDPERVLGAAAEHGVLHHQDVGADLDPAAVPGDDRPVQDPAAGADRDVSGDDRGRGDPGRGIDGRHPTKVAMARRTLRA